MARLPQFNPSKLNEAQAEIHHEIVCGPRGKFGGPFHALIQAPDIAGPAQALGAALRFNTELDPQHREIAILTTARFWRNEVEWNAHVVIALREGVSSECIEGILLDRMPASLSAEQRLVYRFCRELLQNKSVADELYQRAEETIGIKQVVEMVSLLGYFGLLAMLLNTFEIEHDPLDGIPPLDLQLTAIAESSKA